MSIIIGTTTTTITAAGIMITGVTGIDETAPTDIVPVGPFTIGSRYGRRGDDHRRAMISSALMPARRISRNVTALSRFAKRWPLASSSKG